MKAEYDFSHAKKNPYAAKLKNIRPTLKERSIFKEF
ncbi:hypothetical protein EV694_1331 [Volucribacter psittacicida]|uniref:Uncharacterized protein n=1 Tax=Volucribacter psittacicida TaxID=203482 RepID=A0A4R1FYN1_9PAST|nr:hypothetical protein EV694_1331 [Volucribacter psittacicida]